MSKLSHDADSERYKALGFRAQFDGTSAGLPWAELIEELKTNVLRQPLRVRKLIMGEYTTKAGEHELAKVAATPAHGIPPPQTNVWSAEWPTPLAFVPA